jgi:cellulose synthase/poly-beta-1,6-N-acetylglucosamine synthase-like glycosyltransferase
VLLHTLLLFGFLREWRRDRRVCNAEKTDDGRNLKVSLVIPIQNEESRMEGLLRSLLEQDYPAEIIFVDDCSSDKSPAMLAQFVKDAALRGMNDCRVITLTENPGPNRKQQALSAGIAGARGGYLLFTGGDCEVPPGWIRAMARRMGATDAVPSATPLAGAVIGPVFKKKRGRGFLFLYQCFDHAIRYYYLAGSTGLGAAGGGFGNNLIVRRAALDVAGGYDAVPPSPTEDAALISLIRSLGGYRIRAVVLPDAVVETDSEQTWRGFINQTLRWNNGGLFSPEPVTRFNYNLLMVIISAGILALPLLPFFPGLWPLPACVFLSMIENTACVFSSFRKKLPKGGPLNLGYVISILFTPVYFTLMTIMGYCGIKPKWKELVVSSS